MRLTLGDLLFAAFVGSILGYLLAMAVFAYTWAGLRLCA